LLIVNTSAAIAGMELGPAASAANFATSLGNAARQRTKAALTLMDERVHYHDALDRQLKAREAYAQKNKKTFRPRSQSSDGSYDAFIKDTEDGRKIFNEHDDTVTHDLALKEKIDGREGNYFKRTADKFSYPKHESVRGLKQEKLAEKRLSTLFQEHRTRNAERSEKEKRAIRRQWDEKEDNEATQLTHPAPISRREHAERSPKKKKATRKQQREKEEHDLPDFVHPSELRQEVFPAPVSPHEHAAILQRGGRFIQYMENLGTGKPFALYEFQSRDVGQVAHRTRHRVSGQQWDDYDSDSATLHGRISS
jgi:hypothetical protein